VSCEYIIFTVTRYITLQHWATFECKTPTTTSSTQHTTTVVCRLTSNMAPVPPPTLSIGDCMKHQNSTQQNGKPQMINVCCQILLQLSEYFAERISQGH